MLPLSPHIQKSGERRTDGCKYTEHYWKTAKMGFDIMYVFKIITLKSYSRTCSDTKEVLSKDPWGPSASIRGQLRASWEYLYCFITQKQAGGKCLHTVLLSTESSLAFIQFLWFIFIFFFHLKWTWVAESLIWLLLSVRMWHSAHTPLWREGERLTMVHTKKPETEEIFESSGARRQATEPHK